MIKDIQLLLTGGTIDSEWDPTADTAVPLARSGIKPYMEKFLRPDFEIYEKVITMADSREIDDNMRHVIYNNILLSKSDRVLIPHGTFTMAQTGRYLQNKIKEDNNPKANNKIIILTGSFYPLVGFAQSDAPYNIGFALGAMEYLTPGVYVAMNSQLFDPNEVDKDITKGKFRKK